MTKQDVITEFSVSNLNKHATGKFNGKKWIVEYFETKRIGSDNLYWYKTKTISTKKYKTLKNAQKQAVKWINEKGKMDDERK